MRREATPGLFYLRSLPRVQDHRAATLPGVQDVPTAASSSVSPAPAAPTSAAVTVSAVTDVTFPTTGWQKLQSFPELCAPVTVQTIVQYFLDSVAADDMPTQISRPWRGRTASRAASSSVDLSKKLKSLVWTITSSEQGASQRCGRVPLTS